MAQLIFFKPQNFRLLEDHLNEEGKEILNFSFVFNMSDSTINWDEIDFNLVAINISSLGTIEDISPQMLLVFENFVGQLDDFIFITDCQNDSFKSRMDYYFDKVIIFEDNVESIEKDSVNSNPVRRKITDLSASDIDNLVKKFSNSLIGHEKFKDQIRDKLIEFKIFHSLGENLIFSFFLLGESGVGKTEVARLFHKLLGGTHSLAKINFGNYSSQDSLNSLIGSPRGYTGSETGELFEKIINSDTGVILIDEFEKATTDLHNYFLEILESGIATSSTGATFDLNGYIFIFTSNIATENFEKQFSPELRSRFNYVSSFNPLSIEDKKKYVYTRFSKYISNLNLRFEKQLPELSIETLTENIDVTKYKNIRILNSKIRDFFMEYIKEQYDPDDEIWK